MGRRAGGILLGWVLLLLGAGGAAALEPAGPEATLRSYLQALKGGKFEDAYALISKDMKQGKDREVWVKEQKTVMATAEVKIFDFQVYPGKVEGGVARVPNVLSSQDRFVNTLGLTEHELYTLVREDGTWKVDQQILVEPPDIPKWFPKQERDGAGGAAPASPPASPPASH
jgi:hypothetical protein